MIFPHIPHLHYIWLVVASTIAGVMNAMAGGGSFLSFPAMLGVGVLPVQANATNTVALWPGQLTSVLTLRKDLRWDLMRVVVGTSIVGGVAGAEVLLHTRQSTFMTLIPWLILCGTILFGISGPISHWLRSRTRHPHAERSIPGGLLSLALLPICFYVGYFGAGGGFLVMTVLALFGVESMYELNAMKVVAALVSNLCAIVTFIASGFVVWHYCVIAMVFAAAGGYVGARWAKRTNPDVLRAFVVCTGCIIAGYFFWRQSQRMTLTKPTIDIIGYMAATMTTISFLPQLIRVIKLRTARDISLGMFLIFTVGTAFWLAYGIFSHSAPVAIANGITLILSGSILVLKLRFDRQANMRVEPAGVPL